jgi:hypothetical protein
MDIGPSTFTNTYLVYLNDSPGELIVDSLSYPIQSNTGFIFNEGLPHKTQNTADVSRLLIGPMNELVESVGPTSHSITYFNTEADANANNNPIGTSASYTVGSVGGYTAWRIASRSTGTSPQIQVYLVGAVLNSDGVYFLYPAFPIPCFLEGSKILTDKGYVPIQDLRKGDLVKTLKHDFKQIDMIGRREIYHPAKNARIQDQLYQCSQTEYPEIFEPLVITGCHSILVENSTTVVNAEQIELVKKVNGGIYLTDDKLRLPACTDLRASVYEIVGNYTIYHLALENDDYYKNYGIYANGLLVETCSKRYLKELSNMTLIE